MNTTNVTCCWDCPLKQMENDMASFDYCGHPKWKDLGEASFLTREVKGTIPKQCPLREEPFISKVQLAH